MAKLTLLLVAAAACGDLQGLGGQAAPLANVDVQITGDLPIAASLRVALVWGGEWIPEPFCVLPAESDAAAAAIRAGCPDSFGFVPVRVAANAPVAADRSARLALFDLPAADVMVGDVTARVAYGSLVLYDDRNGNGTLDLRRSRRDPGEPDAGVEDAGMPQPVGPNDVVYGASFVSMTQPDRRVAFREGEFNAAAAFYPRDGCPAPRKGFSILGAGGFSAASAIAAALQGKLPPEDPATCAEAPLEGTVVPVATEDPSRVSDVACRRRGSSGFPRYREPPDDQRSIADRTYACAGVPHLGDGPSTDGIVQLVVAGPPEDLCESLAHYLLKGCEDDPACALPQWDRTASRPEWWPCER